MNAYYYDVPNKIIAKAYSNIIIEKARDFGIDVNEYPDKTNGAILHALNFQTGTRSEFETIINKHPIKHIITLGEPVYQVLRERYNLNNLSDKIKDVLKLIENSVPIITILDREMTLLPMPHIFNGNNAKWQFYKDFIDTKLPQLANKYITNYKDERCFVKEVKEGGIRGKVIHQWVQEGKPKWDYEQTKTIVIKADHAFQIQQKTPAPKLRQGLENDDQSYIFQWIGGCKFPWLEKYIY